MFKVFTFLVFLPPIFFVFANNTINPYKIILNSFLTKNHKITSRNFNGKDVFGKFGIKQLNPLKTQICECPLYRIKASKYRVKAGNTVTFYGKILMKPKNVSYDWTVSIGTIIEGQGTSKIKVKTTKEMAGLTLTATFEPKAKNICSSCTFTASESVLLTN